MPERIQLRRTKGWRLPEGAVRVARPGRCGNPYAAGRTTPIHWNRDAGVHVRDAAHAVELFRGLAAASPAYCAEARAELAGKDLACWCAPGAPCHADVLLEIAADPIWASDPPVSYPPPYQINRGA